MTGLEPAAVSLAAFWIAALRGIVQGVSLAANFSLRRIKNWRQKLLTYRN